MSYPQQYNQTTQAPAVVTAQQQAPMPQGFVGPNQSQPQQPHPVNTGSHIQPQQPLSTPSGTMQTHQGQMSAPGTHLVETVDAGPAQHAGTPSQPIEGAGIDARTATDPKVIAEQQTVSAGGAPGAAQGRISLIQSALACKLAEFLLNDVLENTTLSSIKDPASAKVHVVDLLKLLTMDPAYGMKFQLILDEQPAWKKYKSQDHSLFITGTEQKADYFLTDGSSGPTMLLTEK